MKKLFRHGDIPVYEVSEVTGEKVKHEGSFILAEGETTGHNHVISVPSVDDMEIFSTPEGGYYMRLKTEASLVHPEHKELIIPAGTYYVGKEREVDHFAGSVTRKVID